MSRLAELIWKPIRWWWNARWGQSGAVFFPIIGVYLLIEGDWVFGLLLVVSFPLWVLLWVYETNAKKKRRTRR
jgi:hypothetical protein